MTTEENRQLFLSSSSSSLSADATEGGRFCRAGEGRERKREREEQNSDLLKKEEEEQASKTRGEPKSLAVEGGASVSSRIAVSQSEREGAQTEKPHESEGAREREEREGCREDAAENGTARKSTGGGEAQEIFKVMKRMDWESQQQCKFRQNFLQKVIRAEERRLGCVDIEDLKFLSSVFFNVRFLQCQYDASLLRRLQSYDPALESFLKFSPAKKKRTFGTDQKAGRGGEEEDLVIS